MFVLFVFNLNTFTLYVYKFQTSQTELEFGSINLNKSTKSKFPNLKADLVKRFPFV